MKKIIIFMITFCAISTFGQTKAENEESPKNTCWYVGNVLDGKLHGKGTLTYICDNKYHEFYKYQSYEGDWVEGKKHGYGTFIWKNGDKYVGYWSNDKANGQGTMKWANGDKYVGEWKNDIPHKGTITYAPDDISGRVSYEGDGNIMHGHGSMAWKNFSITGDWAFGLIKKGVPVLHHEYQVDSQDTLNYANGNRYIGKTKNGNCNGLGILYYADGGFYIGSWKDNQKDGAGVYYSKDELAEGFWENDTLKTGRRTIYEEEHIKLATWKNGECVSLSFSGKILRE